MLSTKKSFFCTTFFVLSLLFIGFEAISEGVWHTGYASFYGKKLAGRKTSSGERFNPNIFTAAHRTLPMGTWVQVKSLRTDRISYVRITDRGPHRKNRMIDVSYAAAKELGIVGYGVSKVIIRPLFKEDITDSLLTALKKKDEMGKRVSKVKKVKRVKKVSKVNPERSRRVKRVSKVYPERSRRVKRP